jgi:hypothetical protein
MSSSTTATFSLPLPTALNDFKLIASQIVKGGGQQVVPLIKRPELPTEQDEDSKALLSIWNDWWSTTAWGSDPTAGNPNWNCASRTGYVWTQFGEAAHANTGHPFVYCYNCNLTLQHPTVNSCGTKHLLNHRKSLACLQTTSPAHSQVNKPISLRNLKRASIRGLAYSPSTFEKEIVRLVIDQNWPFRTVEQPLFQQFVRFLRPDAVIISRYKFGQIFKSQFLDAKAALLQDLDKDTTISIALDAWTGANHLSFLAIKGYYINAYWQLKEKLLDFIPMRGKHTGVSMAKEVLKVLKAFNKTKKLLAITCDNASNNSTLSRTLESSLKEETYPWNSRENTIPCLAHIINLVVQDIIQHLKLSASVEAEYGNTLQRQHIKDIQTEVSVPNSLRKVRRLLSQLFITY